MPVARPPDAPFGDDTRVTAVAQHAIVLILAVGDHAAAFIAAYVAAFHLLPRFGRDRGHVGRDLPRPLRGLLFVQLLIEIGEQLDRALLAADAAEGCADRD